MFIHHVFITGCSDRGAWPWRQPAALNAWWHLGPSPACTRGLCPIQAARPI